MDTDLVDRISHYIEIVLSSLGGSIWLLFLVGAALSNIFKRRKNQAAAPTARKPSTVYSGNTYRSPPQSVQPTQPRPAMATMRDRKTGREPSIWAERPEDDGKLVWESPFEHDQSEKKWGFDETEWGSSFDRPKQDEPKITIS